MQKHTDHIQHVLLLLLVCLAIGFVMGIALDINQFSMSAVYRNRLIRCYLRAVRRTGQPNWVTNLDLEDDIRLSSLLPSDHAPFSGRPFKKPEEEARARGEARPSSMKTWFKRPPEPPSRPYYGPYVLINTTLNLTNPYGVVRPEGATEQGEGRSFGWQERKGAAFVLSPAFCGSNLTGYRPTKYYADDITLGTAMAISGAAFSSNMGYQTNRALAFFLSMFNVRLGWWLGNPGGIRCNRQGPRWGLFYLFVELLRWADVRRRYVYLSDGGHFDNLGLYELVRRRCRYIVCSDAGEDPAHGFDDLGMAIRKIRADLGVDIEIDLEMLRLRKDSPYSRWHHAIGTIRYDQVDENAPVGMLVYIKASLVGDEPADVLEYKTHHQAFPHESTIDQWFSESQFEAYRRLGEHIGMEVFRSAQQDLDYLPEVGTA